MTHRGPCQPRPCWDSVKSNALLQQRAARAQTRGDGSPGSGGVAPRGSACCPGHSCSSTNDSPRRFPRAGGRMMLLDMFLPNNRTNIQMPQALLHLLCSPPSASLLLIQPPATANHQTGAIAWSQFGQRQPRPRKLGNHTCSQQDHPWPHN